MAASGERRSNTAKGQLGDTDKLKKKQLLWEDDRRFTKMSLSFKVPVYP